MALSKGIIFHAYKLINLPILSLGFNDLSKLSVFDFVSKCNNLEHLMITIAKTVKPEFFENLLYICVQAQQSLDIAFKRPSASRSTTMKFSDQALKSLEIDLWSKHTVSDLDNAYIIFQLSLVKHFVNKDMNRAWSELFGESQVNATFTYMKKSVDRVFFDDRGIIVKNIKA